VYLGATAGSFSHTKPLAPNHLVYLGFVTTASNGSAGRMYVRVQNGYELDEIHDVKITSVANNDVLKYNSSNGLWENSNALSTKQDTITGAATTITSSNLTTYRALVSDGGGKVAVAATTSNEIGYLSGVTSNIQTQLDGKTSVARSFMAVNQNATVVGSGTTYGSFILSGFNVAESARIFVVPYACTMRNFYVRIFAAQPATGSLVFTLRKNLADTSVVVTIAAGSAAGTEANSGATTATFAAGDDCSIKVVNNATGTSGTINNTSIMIEI
jgi:hypothetical protein